MIEVHYLLLIKLGFVLRIRQQNLCFQNFLEKLIRVNLSPSLLKAFNKYKETDRKYCRDLFNVELLPFTVVVYVHKKL